MTQAGAVLIYGRGGDLGDFKQFGDDLVTRSLRSKYGLGIKAFRAERHDAFFDALSKAKAPIRELHIFSHSYGGALMLGYGDYQTGFERLAAMDRFRGRPTPQQVVLNTEKGALFVHDLFRAPYAGFRESLRRKFAPGAFIKIWGCNAGIEGHVYMDDLTVSLEPPIVERTASSDFRTGDEFYWRALNGTRLPSIASAMANFFNVPVIAARSGASVLANMGKRWISSTAFKAVKSRWPRESDDIRLHPERGDYAEFRPGPR
jgi:pimeloyl-ACP methyl ester carboxylesterase